MGHVATSPLPLGGLQGVRLGDGFNNGPQVDLAAEQPEPLIGSRTLRNGAR